MPPVPEALTARRIVVRGTSGAGKTTFTRALGARLGLPVVELDALNHGPNWQAAPVEEFRARVASSLDDHDAWVVDGNYDRRLGSLVLDRADLIIWLDLPLRVKLRRLWFRTTRRIRSGEELWNGNRENWRSAFWGQDSLFAWAIVGHRESRRAWTERHAGHPVVRLRTQAEVARYLRNVVAPP